MGRRGWKLALILSLAALLVPADSALADSCGFGRYRADQTTAKRLRLATLCLLNRERERRGVRGLKVDPRLRLAARRHAGDMVARRYFAHVSLGGSDPAERIRATGYMSRVRRWLIGENLGWGAGPLSTPADRVHALMQSPPHRQNMLRIGFREVGIWVAQRTPVRAAYPHGATYVINFGSVR